MEPSDLTVEILKSIRDEVRGTNARLDQTNARLDQTNARLERLEHRQTEAEVRLATELVAVADAVREVRDTLIDSRGLRTQVDDHERRLVTLEARGG